MVKRILVFVLVIFLLLLAYKVLHVTPELEGVISERVAKEIADREFFAFKENADLEGAEFVGFEWDGNLELWIFNYAGRKGEDRHLVSVLVDTHGNKELHKMVVRPSQ